MHNVTNFSQEIYIGLTDIDKLEKIGTKITDLVKANYPGDTNHYQEKIDKLTAYARSLLSNYQREQRKLKDYYQ